MTTSPSDLHPYLIAQYAVILWDHGYTAAEIALVLGRYHTTIRHHLTKAGRLHSYGRVGRPKTSDHVVTRASNPPPIPREIKKRIKECGLRTKRI